MIFFKNKSEQVVKGKPTKELIEEIHDTFYTEVDRLLVEANIKKPLSTDKQDMIDKADRLKSLGFTNTAEVVEAFKEERRLHEVQSENDRKDRLIEAIKYFSFKYPNYKFITEDSVKKICEKYNLVYSTIDRYIGTVPDKNLKHIEDFKIDENDICHYEEGFTHSFMYGKHVFRSQYINKEMCDDFAKDVSPRHFATGVVHFFDRCPLEIAAPVKDFNLENSEIKNFKISTKIDIPDPVVLQPVYFKGNKHFLIITAWGDEASDELVVNHVMN